MTEHAGIARAAGWKLAVTAVAIAALAAGFALVQAQTAGYAHAATAKVTSYSKASGASGFKSAKMGKTCGKTGGKALVAIKVKNSGKVKGNVVYSVNARGVSGWKKAKNGKVAQTKKNKPIQQLKISVSGKLKKSYNIWYRVHVKGYGWMGWAKNGAAAGSAGCNKDVTAYEVKLVAKTAEQPNTDRAAFSNAKGFLKTVSGSAKADKLIASVAKAQKMDLKKCFDWCTYGKGNIRAGSTLGTMTTSGAWPASRIKQEAEKAFIAKAGDCYTYSTAFYCLAKYLGYDTRPMAGQHMTTGMVYKPTSWVEIKLGGETFIYDTMQGEDYYEVSAAKNLGDGELYRYHG